jgi:hypothetical protein
MRKKLSVMMAIVFVVAIALTASGPAVAGGKGGSSGGDHGCGNFKDVEQGNWAYRDITVMEAKGVFGGYGNGQFGPQDPVSCIQLTILAVRLTGSEAAAGAMPLDEVATILSGSWLDSTDPLPTWAGVRECLAFAYANGYLNGIVVQEQKLFRPNDAATRLEVVVTLLDAMGLGAAAAALAGSTITAPDADTVPTWAVGYVALAMDMGLLRGDKDGNLNLAGTVTRAQMAALLSRADDKFESKVDDAVIEGELVSTTAGDAPTITIIAEAEELRDYVEQPTPGTTGGTTTSSVDGSVAEDVEDDTYVEVTLPVGADVAIFRDGAVATLADLAVGDDVELRVADGVVIFIDACSTSSDDCESDLEVAGSFVSAEYADTVLTSITITVVAIDGEAADEGDCEDNEGTTPATPPAGGDTGTATPELGADATFPVSPGVVIKGVADGAITFAAGDFLVLKILEGQVVAIEPESSEDEDEDEEDCEDPVNVTLKATFDSATADTITFTITGVDDDCDLPAGYEIDAQLTLNVSADLKIRGPGHKDFTLADFAAGDSMMVNIRDGAVSRLSLVVDDDCGEDD